MRFLLFLTALLFPVLAYAADHTFSLIPAANYLIDYAVVAAVGVIGWALSRVTNGIRKWLGIRIDDSQRAVVMGAVERGVNYAADIVRLKIASSNQLTINMRSMLIAEGIKYVQGRVPDALAHFKLTPNDVGEMLTAKFEENGVVDKLKATLESR